MKEACKMTVNKYIDERSMQDDCKQIYRWKKHARWLLTNI